MGRCNKRYTSQREKKFIEKMKIYFQEPGTHDEWAKKLISQGASAAQIKPVHSLDNDAKKEFFLSRIQNKGE